MIDANSGFLMFLPNSGFLMFRLLKDSILYVTISNA